MTRILGGTLEPRRRPRGRGRRGRVGRDARPPDRAGQAGEGVEGAVPAAGRPDLRLVLPGRGGVAVLGVRAPLGRGLAGAGAAWPGLAVEPDRLPVRPGAGHAPGRLERASARPPATRSSSAAARRSSGWPRSARSGSTRRGPSPPGRPRSRSPAVEHAGIGPRSWHVPRPWRRPRPMPCRGRSAAVARGTSRPTRARLCRDRGDASENRSKSSASSPAAGVIGRLGALASPRYRWQPLAHGRAGAAPRPRLARRIEAAPGSRALGGAGGLGRRGARPVRLRGAVAARVSTR